MIWFFTPYSFEKKMLAAWQAYMGLVKDDDDWVVMMDGDIAIFQANFGHIVREYIDKYPDTGLFTCYASRSGTGYMMPEKNLMNAHNIMIHHHLSEKLQRERYLRAKEIDRRVTGHFMCIKKATWKAISKEVEKECEGLNILSVDTKISETILRRGMKIRLMESLYVLHYYRLKEVAKRKQMLG